MKRWRIDFPVFSCRKKLVYLDSAATSQKPQVVIDAVSDFYTNGCANIHRAVHDLGEQATSQYNAVRQKVAKFINAQFNEIIFTTGTTAGINLVATAWGDKFIEAGDEIIVSMMEHHANLVSWQELARRSGATLKILNLTHDFQLDLNQYHNLLTSKTKLIAISYGSNVLGTVNDLTYIIDLAKKNNTVVLIDAAQVAPYFKIDMQKLDCDFLVFSGHKMFAPEGVGVLYMKQKWHDQIPPYQFGGGMVANVTLEQSTFLKAPEKFEAGTMPIGSILGLGAAIDYYNKIDLDLLKAHLANLCTKLIEGLIDLPGINIIGNIKLLKNHGHLVSFTVDGIHAHDVAAYLNQFGICVRAGHHCAQPLHEYLGLAATARVSFHIYNDITEIDYFLACLAKLVQQGI